ncbi:MAG: hypothetical protein DIZ80_02825 [endosymbiont of Galathealinum brachiosum]|uniref:Uncharacterized protein n=1 Tax=endosymbiont of Galathealinum brachiosum TaxID=2200906 RepID=A0A370DHM2_9GAMM|nr:MAG: hypothetical protein DIZ80_02825 [endosymbiont of Galathealinum brachiosum]
MNDLIETLLDCPNLSLRLLDSKTGRSVKTVNHDQLQKMLVDQQVNCSKDCGNMSCQNRSIDD